MAVARIQCPECKPGTLLRKAGADYLQCDNCGRVWVDDGPRVERESEDTLRAQMQDLLAAAREVLADDRFAELVDTRDAVMGGLAAAVRRVSA